MRNDKTNQNRLAVTVYNSCNGNNTNGQKGPENTPKNMPELLDMIRQQRTRQNSGARHSGNGQPNSGTRAAKTAPKGLPAVFEYLDNGKDITAMVKHFDNIAYQVAIYSLRGNDEFGGNTELAESLLWLKQIRDAFIEDADNLA